MSVLNPSSSTWIHTLAQYSPSKLLLKPRFWIAQKRFLLLCAASGLAFALLAPYTYEAATGFALLTACIHCLALGSAFFTIRSVARLEIETAILTVIETRASLLLTSLKARQITAPTIDQLEEEVLPDNRTTPTPAMVRLFQHICKEARDRKFESSINVVQPYREEPLEEIFRLQNLQKIALWLGILGTFIGLMLAIQQGNLGDLKTLDNFAEIVRNMFADLFNSFSASLAGLEVAVVLGFFLLLLRKKQEAYFELMESTALTMLSLVRKAHNDDDLVAEFAQVSTAMSQLNQSVAAQTTVLSNRLNNLQQQIIQQNVQIQRGLEKLMTTGRDFDGFLNGLSDSQKQFLDDINAMHDSVTFKNLAPMLRETILTTTSHISDAIKPNVSLISTQLTDFNKSIGTLNDTLNRQSQSVRESVTKLEHHAKEQSTSNLAALRELRTRMNEPLKTSPPVATNNFETQQLLRSISMLDQKVDSLRLRLDGSARRSPGVHSRFEDLTFTINQIVGQVTVWLSDALQVFRRKRL
jgi:uncharacterized protein YoxC